MKSRVVSDEDRTIKIILNKAKKEVTKEKAQSISSTVASLTYNQGRTNYFVYKVVDNNNYIINGEENVFVYFIDEFGTRLASPKLLGGWRIEEIA